MFLPILLVITWFRPSTEDTMLFVATPGGEDSGPGLYGAVVNDIDKSPIGSRKLRYDFKFGFHCLPPGGSSSSGDDFELESVAYDDVTGHVLLRRRESRDVITLYEGHVCQNGGGCADRKRGSLRLLYDGVHFRYKKPKSFAYHDRAIYFLSQESHQPADDDDDAVTNVVELRRLTGCGANHPVTGSSGFDAGKCSELLATLVTERGGTPPGHEPLSGLRLFSSGGALHALAVVEQLVLAEPPARRRKAISRLLVHLYAVRLRPGAGRVVRLHTETVRRPAYRRFIMSQLGDVDYHDDKVCWSAIDRILCADLFEPRDRVSRVRYIVPPGVASGLVCRGQDLFANVTTGVAIADVTDDVVSLFFGCMADTSGTGGTGFVRMRHWDVEMTPEPLPVRNVSSELYSGQMFMSRDKCKYVKNVKQAEVAETPSLQRTGYVVDGGSAKGGATSRQAEVVCLSLLTFIALAFRM